MFHIPFLMVFYHVRTIIVPIGMCVSAFICAGVYNLINGVTLLHILECLSLFAWACVYRKHACTCRSRGPSRSVVGANFPLQRAGLLRGSALFMNQAY